MATTLEEQKDVFPTLQVFKGPNVSIAGSKNIVSRLDITQCINGIDMPSSHNCLSLVSMGIAPNDDTGSQYADSVFDKAGVGSMCHHFVGTEATGVTAYKQWHKVAGAGAAADWKEVSYV